LLIEAQVFGMPIEVLDHEFKSISLATAAGIIVIEAAGNGSMNLDLYKTSSGAQVLNPAATGFRESGAIMVAAATSAHPHMRFDSSNFGARINCFAWGQNVTTCHSNGVSATAAYRGDFGQTSAASAIIAGVAASVQGMVEQNFGRRLGPLQMRKLLS